jgi:hypothetical protein
MFPHLRQAKPHGTTSLNLDVNRTKLKNPLELNSYDTKITVTEAQHAIIS